MRQHPAVPNVFFELTPQGLMVRCVTRGCGVHGFLQQGASVDQFAAQHQHYYGAGDVVAGVAGALGAKPCTPCQARQQMMNRWLPRVFRR